IKFGEKHNFDISQGVVDVSLSDKKVRVSKKYPDGLYQFQREGVDFIRQAKGRVILADEMGVGKTITSLAFMQMYAGKTLVVSPASVIYKWEMECEKWTDRTVSVVGTGKEEMQQTDVHVMSYGIMTARYDELATKPYDLLIFDESHYLLHYRSQRSRVARALIGISADKVLFLSGTPFLNRPAELFPLLNMLSPASYSSYFSFVRRYCGASYDEFDGWIKPADVVTNKEELLSRLSGILLRRTKRDVLKELPELTRTLVPVNITNRASYSNAINGVRKWRQEQETVSYATTLTKLTAAAQAIGLGKVLSGVGLARDILNSEEKVVIFAHHKAVVSKIADMLSEYGVLTIVGDVSNKQRQKNVVEFLKSGNGIRVMVISTAGAEGIDLYSASNIIFIERSWTPAKEEQAESRCHRIGQTNPVTAWYLVAKDTYDEKMADTVDRKRKVFGEVIRQDEIVTTVLEDIINL
ncbi:MAG: DEAD/DEAH box helicase, partial [Candidatus Scalindua sp.]|nr:DEAD/DEAH box helicase [Candidatus Scalindua sp.]